MPAYIITDNGQAILAGVLTNTPFTDQDAITYCALGTGTGTLAAQVIGGVACTSLSVAPLAAPVLPHATLTLVNGSGGNYSATQDVTATAAGAARGATSIPVVSFTPPTTYPAGSMLTRTPSSSDTQLEAEAFRGIITSASFQTSHPVTTSTTFYVAPNDVATTTFCEVGWFAGDASATPNSGILVARTVMVWAHTAGADSCQFLLTMTL